MSEFEDIFGEEEKEIDFTDLYKHAEKEKRKEEKEKRKEEKKEEKRKEKIDKEHQGKTWRLNKKKKEEKEMTLEDWEKEITEYRKFIKQKKQNLIIDDNHTLSPFHISIKSEDAVYKYIESSPEDIYKKNRRIQLRKEGITEDVEKKINNEWKKINKFYNAKIYKDGFDLFSYEQYLENRQGLEFDEYRRKNHKLLNDKWMRLSNENKQEYENDVALLNDSDYLKFENLFLERLAEKKGKSIAELSSNEIEKEKERIFDIWKVMSDDQKSTLIKEIKKGQLKYEDYEIAESEGSEEQEGGHEEESEEKEIADFAEAIEQGFMEEELEEAVQEEQEKEEKEEQEEKEVIEEKKSGKTKRGYRGKKAIEKEKEIEKELAKYELKEERKKEKQLEKEEQVGKGKTWRLKKQREKEEDIKQKTLEIEQTPPKINKLSKTTIIKYPSCLQYLYTKLLPDTLSQIEMKTYKLKNKDSVDKLYRKFVSLISLDVNIGYYTVKGKELYSEFDTGTRNVFGRSIPAVAYQYIINMYREHINNIVNFIFKDKKLLNDLLSTGNSNIRYSSPDPILSGNHLNLWGEYITGYRNNINSINIEIRNNDPILETIERVFKINEIKEWIYNDFKRLTGLIDIFYEYLKIPRKGYAIFVKKEDEKKRKSINYQISGNIVNYVMTELLDPGLEFNGQFNIDDYKPLLEHISNKLGELFDIKNKSTIRDVYHYYIKKILYIVGKDTQTNDELILRFKNFAPKSISCKNVDIFPNSTSNCILIAMRYVITTLMDWLDLSEVSENEITTSLKIIFNIDEFEYKEKEDFKMKSLIQFFEENDITLLNNVNPFDIFVEEAKPILKEVISEVLSREKLLDEWNNLSLEAKATWESTNASLGELVKRELEERKSNKKEDKERFNLSQNFPFLTKDAIKKIKSGSLTAQEFYLLRRPWISDNDLLILLKEIYYPNEKKVKALIENYIQINNDACKSDLKDAIYAKFKYDIERLNLSKFVDKTVSKLGRELKDCRSIDIVENTDIIVQILSKVPLDKDDKKMYKEKAKYESERIARILYFVIDKLGNSEEDIVGKISRFMK